MAAEIRISIVTSSDGGAVKDVEKNVQNLGQTAKEAGGGFSAMREIAVGALRELGAAALNVVGGGLKALGGAVVDGITDAREAAKVMAQTEAVIKSTGGAAGLTAEQVANLAGEMSAAAGKSLFGDDDIQKGENLLLTFTNIGKDVFPQATQAMVDMAQAMGTDVSGGAIQLGKALNDPIKGVGALSRVGVTFTQDQKDMIQAMVETGDVAGAQQIILAELNKEFGGSAAAAAAADGGWAQFNDRLGEAKETIGAAVLPLLNILVGFLNDQVMPTVEAAAAAFSAWLADPAVQAGVQQLAAAIQEGLGVALTFLTQTAIPALIAGWNAIQPAIQALLPVVAGAIAIFQGAGDKTTELGGVLQQVGLIWTEYRALVQAELAAIWQIIQAVLTQIMAFWTAHGTEIMAFAQTTWDTIVQIVRLAIELLQATIVPALQYIAAFIQSHGTEIQGILTVVWDTIKTIITVALGLIKGILQVALSVIKGDWQGAWDAIKGIATTVWEAIKTLFRLNLDLINILFRQVWDGIKAYFQGIMDSIVGWVVQTFEGIKNAIVSSAGKLRSAAGGVADAIVDGIASGISNGASAIINAAKDAAMSALNAAKSALGISSPSTVFMEVGRNSAAGMAMGLAQGAPMVAAAGAGVAGAAVGGARSYDQRRTVNYSPTIHTSSHADTMDFNVAMSLAGM